MDKLIPPFYILAAFLPEDACEGCGQQSVARRLGYPQVRWFGETVQLIYPMRCCECNRSSSLTIELPTLFFGVILAKCAAIGADARWRRSKAMLEVPPGKSEILDHIHEEFGKIIGGYALGRRNRARRIPIGDLPKRTKPSDSDRKRFGLSKPQWEKFLQRLGIESDE